MAADSELPGETLRLGLVGRGIGASLSPAMHKAEGRAQGLKVSYALFDTATPPWREMSLKDIIADAMENGFRGLNVTHPFKEQAVGCADKVSDDAKRLGAVNTLVFDNGRITGHNTDHRGFERSFQDQLSDCPKDAVLLLGAGGAGSAVAFALLDSGVRNLMIFDKNRGRAERLMHRLQSHEPLARLAVVADVSEADVATLSGVVNATPMGMKDHAGSAFPLSLLRPALWVADIVYFPLETELLAAARAAGCKVMPGAGMAIWQAVLAFGLFTGKSADPARVKHVFDRLAGPAGASR